MNKKKPLKISEQEARRILKEEPVITINQPTEEMPLRVIRHKFFGLKMYPSDIREDSPEGVVLYNLCLCYKNQGNVSEGVIGDVIWGFRQSGIPGNITLEGFQKLLKLGYITLTDPKGAHVFGDIKGDLYYKWTNKFLKCLAENQEEGTIRESKQAEDTTVNKLK